MTNKFVKLRIPMDASSPGLSLTDAGPKERPVHAATPRAETKELQTSSSKPLIQGRRRRAAAPRGRSRGPPSLPPAIHVVPVVDHVFRFINSSNVGFSAQKLISRAMIGGALGGIVDVTNSSHISWAGSAKINSVTVWPAAGGTAGVTWIATGTAEGALIRDDAVSEDVPTGITMDPKPLVFRPPKGTYASMWQALNVNSTDTLIGVYGTSGSVWDLHVTFTLACNATGPANTVATGVLGAEYYLYLDGSTSHLFVPQGVPSTF